MQIHKPENLITHLRPFRAGENTYMSLTAWVGYQRTPAAGILDEAALLRCLYQAQLQTPLDPGLPKVNGETLVHGHAYPPFGNRISQHTVRLQMDSIDKSLLVFGDRRWVLQDRFPLPGGAEHFSSMPIDWAHAFGGPGFDANPTGIGAAHGDRLQPDQMRPLPNIENPKDTVREWNSRPTPAGFLPRPLGLRIEPGADLPTNAATLATPIPDFKEDLDWHFFNSAPPDQQIDRFWDGGESFRITGMHPTSEEMDGTAPPARIRCFLMRSSKGESLSVEIPLRMDTIWIFPEQELSLSLWRGAFPLTDVTAPEIRELHLLSEPTSEPPRSHESYLESWAEGRILPEAFPGNLAALHGTLCGYEPAGSLASIYLNNPDAFQVPSDEDDAGASDEDAIRAAYAAQMDALGIGPSSDTDKGEKKQPPEAAAVVEGLRANGIDSPETESKLMEQEMDAKIAQSKTDAILARLKGK